MKITDVLAEKAYDRIKDAWITNTLPLEKLYHFELLKRHI